MNKKLTLIILAVLLLTSSVLATKSYTVSTPSTITAIEGETKTTSFTITNDGNETLSNLAISLNSTSTSTLTDGTNTITINFNQTSIQNFLNQTSETITVNATIPSDFDIGTYKAIIDLNGDSITKTASFDIVVDPNVCSDGKKGNDFSVDIQNLDSGDDFKPGDLMDIEADVSNDGSDDMDVKVEASLWDMDKGKKIAYVRSDEQNIDEDSDETFNLEIQLPYTGFDADNNYKLFVKAYESGNEDDNCNYESQSQNLELEDDEVIIEKFTLTPNIVNCGDQVTAAVDVLNIGTNDQDDVTVKILNTELKLDKSSSAFSLDQYGDSDDDMTETFIFTIPETSQEKDYSITAAVYSDGPSNSQTQSLKVMCEAAQQTATATTSTTGSLSTPLTLKSASIGSTLPFSYVITNPSAQSQTYSLELTPLGAWASPQSQTVTVCAGQASSFTLNVPISTNIAEGTYSASVKLLSSGKILDTKSLSVELLRSNYESEPNKFTSKTVLDDLKIGNIPLCVWIVLNVILALIILSLAYLLLRK